MKEIDDAVKLVLIKNKLQRYQNTYYDLRLELEIANEVEDERARTSATNEMVKIKKAIALLEKKKEEIEKEVKDFISE